MKKKNQRLTDGGRITDQGGGAYPSRHVELDIDIGADAKDWSANEAGQKLQPVEAELRRIEEMVAEVVTELDYLRMRERNLRDTNESTNERVKWFAFGTMGMLVGLGAWQIVYLRAYFRYVLFAVALLLAQTHTTLQIQAPDLEQEQKMDGIMHSCHFTYCIMCSNGFIGTVSAIPASHAFSFCSLLPFSHLASRVRLKATTAQSIFPPQ
jgi:hypothetical protein